MALNFVTFNQDNSLIGVGTSKGFRQYTTEPYSKYYENTEGDVAMVEMLYSTSLVALVLSPRLLRIMNTRRNTIIVELTFPTMILAIRMNRKRLAVVLENDVYLYDMSNMKNIQQISTSPNPHAICALSSSSENNYLVYPRPSKRASQLYNQPAHAPPSNDFLPSTSGEVLIYDANQLEAINVIEAHQTALSNVVLNSDGTILATASEKGTILRVFSVPSGQKLFQFRRGSLPAQIFCMAFNATSTLLCVSSATETIHIFRLLNVHNRSGAAPESTGSISSSHVRQRSYTGIDDRSANFGDDGLARGAELDESSTSGDRAKQSSPTFASMIRRTSQNVGMSLAARVGGYLPSSVTEMWEPQRDFAWVKVPKFSSKAASGPIGSVVAMSANHPQLMVVTGEGRFYVYSIDLDKGGEGILEHEYSQASGAAPKY